MRTPHIEINSKSGWTIARVCLTIAAGMAISFHPGWDRSPVQAAASAGLVTVLFDRPPPYLGWLSIWLTLSLILETARLWYGHRTLVTRLLDVLLSAMGTVVLACVALGDTSAASEPAALTVPLALMFAATATVTIVKLGFLLEGRPAIIQLTDA